VLNQIARVSFLAMLLLGLAALPSEPHAGGGGGWGGHAGGSGGQASGWSGHSGHHGHHHGAVVVGVGSWWWGPGWWGYPYWYPYPYGYYPPYYPTVVDEPVDYIQSPPQPTAYWYYCLSAQAYYPQTPSCAEPWIQVPPRRE